MDNSLTLKQKRRDYLMRVHDLAKGNERNYQNMFAVGHELGLDESETQQIVQYLVSEQLLRYPVSGGIIAITHRGVVEVEEARDKPQKPTQHFPAINVIHIENMNNSQIQQGTHGSSQQRTEMLHPLNKDEERLLIEMVRADEKSPEGTDKSFWVIPPTFDDPLPSLSHSFLPDGQISVPEGNLSALVEAGYLRRLKLNANIPWFEVTEAGRRYARQIQKDDPASRGLQNRDPTRNCLILTPFTAGFDHIRSILIDVVQKAGAWPVFIENMPQGDFFIWESIRKAIETADLFVVDITGSNMNIMYELGYVHALKKPIVHLIQKGEGRAPLDLSAFTTYIYDPQDPNVAASLNVIVGRWLTMTLPTLRKGSIHG